MSEMKYVCLYVSYREMLRAYSVEERGRLFDAMLDYAIDGIEAEFTGNERFLWPSLLAQMKRDAVAYQETCSKNRRNGARGGRKKADPETDRLENVLAETDRLENASPETQRFLEEPKKPNEKENEKENDNENEKENDNENESENEKENESEKESESEKERKSLSACPSDKPRAHFSPPSGEEVRIYCTEKGIGVNPERFVDYYTSNGWMVGKNQMRDWKAAVRNWDRKENPDGQAESKPLWTFGTVL